MKSEFTTAVKCVKYLKALKEQDRKDSELISFLYSHGIDIINYESKYQWVARVLLAEAIGCTPDDIDWWLYEDVIKIYYLDDGREIPVGEPEEFVGYYLSLKEANEQNQRGE